MAGEARIGERVGRGVNKYKIAKHFTWTISEHDFSYARNQASITQEAALDGLYVLRTNLSKEQLDAPRVVLAYKSLSQVEQAFRHLKLGELEVRSLSQKYQDTTYSVSQCQKDPTSMRYPCNIM